MSARFSHGRLCVFGKELAIKYRKTTGTGEEDKRKHCSYGNERLGKYFLVPICCLCSFGKSETVPFERRSHDQVLWIFRDMLIVYAFLVMPFTVQEYKFSRKSLWAMFIYFKQDYFA